MITAGIEKLEKYIEYNGEKNKVYVPRLFRTLLECDCISDHEMRMVMDETPEAREYRRKTFGFRRPLLRESGNWERDVETRSRYYIDCPIKHKGKHLYVCSQWYLNDPESAQWNLEKLQKWTRRIVDTLSLESHEKPFVGSRPSQREKLVLAKTSTQDPAESEMPLFSLWKQFSLMQTQLSKKIGRSANILGEIAERVVANYHCGKLLTTSSASADVVLEDGRRIQVKARTPRQTTTTSLSIIRSWNFDILAILLFDEFGDVVFGGEIDVESAKAHAIESKHQHGYIITTTKAFLNDPNMCILTDQFNKTLMSL